MSGSTRLHYSFVFRSHILLLNSLSLLTFNLCQDLLVFTIRSSFGFTFYSTTYSIPFNSRLLITFRFHFNSPDVLPATHYRAINTIFFRYEVLLTSIRFHQLPRPYSDPFDYQLEEENIIPDPIQYQLEGENEENDKS